MMKFALGVLALTALLSLTGASSAQACNGSLTDDSKTCDPSYDDNAFWNERYCQLYGHAYDSGKSCGRYGYKPRPTPYKPTPRPPNNGWNPNPGSAAVLCEAKDYAGRRFRVQGTSRQTGKMQGEAMQYCYNHSASPRSCYFVGCYSN